MRDILLLLQVMPRFCRVRRPDIWHIWLHEETDIVISDLPTNAVPVLETLQLNLPSPSHLSRVSCIGHIIVTWSLSRII